MRVAEAKVTLGVVAARAGDLGTAAEYGAAALQGARQSIPSIVMVGQDLAAEIRHVGGADTTQLRDYVDELRAATLPTGSVAARRCSVTRVSEAGREPPPRLVDN